MCTFIFEESFDKFVSIALNIYLYSLKVVYACKCYPNIKVYLNHFIV
jgi:hypothetical protein